jgi:hypothetical protein
VALKAEKKARVELQAWPQASWVVNQSSHSTLHHRRAVSFSAGLGNSSAVTAASRQCQQPNKRERRHCRQVQPCSLADPATTSHSGRLAATPVSPRHLPRPDRLPVVWVSNRLTPVQLYLHLCWGTPATAATLQRRLDLVTGALHSRPMILRGETRFKVC